MDQVFFDGPSKVIRCLDHVEELKVIDLYSEWKRWVLEDDNSKYLPAFNVVGGEATIANEIIEPYFFLINDWKIKPKEADHQLIVRGLLFATNGTNPVVSTDGPYTVTVVSMVPLVTATTINYGEIQRAALSDMMEEFIRTSLLYTSQQEQAIRDAMLIDPTPGRYPSLRSLDTKIERIDMNTQKFGTKIGNLTVDVDTTALENKISAISTKIENMSGINGKIDTLLIKSDNSYTKLYSTNLTVDQMKQMLLSIQAKIDAL
jgi:hypothetical protein